jgi:hypothetical protein
VLEVRGEAMSFRPYKPRSYATTKEVVTRVVDQAGGVKKVAHALDRSQSQTVAYTDPSLSDEITYAQIRRLTELTGVVVAAEDLAALAGGAFLPVPPEGQGFDLLVSRSAKEWGEFIANVLKCRADGKLDDAECRGLLKELDILIRTLVAVRCQVHQSTRSEHE